MGLIRVPNIHRKYRLLYSVPSVTFWLSRPSRNLAHNYRKTTPYISFLKLSQQTLKIFVWEKPCGNSWKNHIGISFGDVKKLLQNFKSIRPVRHEIFFWLVWLFF